MVTASRADGASRRKTKVEATTMKDIKTMKGQIFTDAEYVARITGGQAELVPDFIPTRDDLRTLAFALAKEILDDEYYLSLQSSRSWTQKYKYRCVRLERLSMLLSTTVQKELNLFLREGRIKVKQDVKSIKPAGRKKSKKK
jgi:hypothetical protein